jgi:hypothetical protein
MATTFVLLVVLSVNPGGIQRKIERAAQTVRIVHIVCLSRVVTIGVVVGALISIVYFGYQFFVC